MKQQVINIVTYNSKYKFIDPIIELNPVIWNANTPRSTLREEWLNKPDKGGYTVHPTPKPSDTVVV